MGLIKISDFLPEVKSTIKKLKQGQISNPLKTDTGIHIVKIGSTITRQEILLLQVELKIRKIMRQQLKTQIKQAVYKQAGIAYPVDLNDKKMEEWRLKLRTN